MEGIGTLKATKLKLYPESELNLSGGRRVDSSLLTKTTKKDSNRVEVGIIRCLCALIDFRAGLPIAGHRSRRGVSHPGIDTSCQVRDALELLRRVGESGRVDESLASRLEGCGLWHSNFRIPKRAGNVTIQVKVS